VLSCGDTFLMPKSSRATEHLWVVITQPEPGASLAVCVSITTRRSNSELTVILYPGDHPFIRHESVVHYADAQILDLDHVQRALDAHISGIVCTQHQPCNQALLMRIQQGLLISKLVPNNVKAFCQRAWGLPP
jgi:hypothetical protein